MLEASQQELKDAKFELHCTQLCLTSMKDDLKDAELSVKFEQSKLERVCAELELSEAEVGHRDRQLEDAH